MTAALIGFAVFAAVVTLTPGVDTLLWLRTAARGSRGAALAAGLGTSLGCLAWAAASGLGLTALLAASRLAYDTLRWAGAAYLVWLGIQAFRKAGRTGAELDVEPGAWRAFRTGLVTNLLNPKAGMLYMSALPQFLPSGAPVLPMSLAMGAIHVVEGLLWCTVVVLLVHRVRGWLSRPTVRRRLAQATGVAFVGFGLRLAFDSSK